MTADVHAKLFARVDRAASFYSELCIAKAAREVVAKLEQQPFVADPWNPVGCRHKDGSVCDDSNCRRAHEWPLSRFTTVAKQQPSLVPLTDTQKLHQFAASVLPLPTGLLAVSVDHRPLKAALVALDQQAANVAELDAAREQLIADDYASCGLPPEALTAEVSDYDWEADC